MNSYRKEDGEATDMIGAKEILLTSPAWGTMGMALSIPLALTDILTRLPESASSM